MGNVLASSKQTAELLPPLASPIPGDSPDASANAKKDTPAYSMDDLENPGSMEELHKRCKGTGEEKKKKT